MADGSPYPLSDTLAPPRKSVELEDPGAHELSEQSPDHWSKQYSNSLLLGTNADLY